MPIAEFSQALADIESRLESVASALGAGDAAGLEAASASLQRVSLALAALVQERHADMDGAESRQRLRKIADRLAIQREGLLRQVASVERTLGVLLPSTRNTPTYGKPLGARRYQA